MAEKLGEAVLELRTDDRGLNRGIDQAERRAERLADNFDRWSGRMASAGARLSLAITAPLIALGAHAARTAIDAEELGDAVISTFGEMGESVKQWAEETGDAMGRSTQSMLRGAFAFGTVLTGITDTRAEAARMSQDLAVLAQDMESRFNRPIDEAVAALRSGLVGETEPLRAFGVLLSEAAVKAEAYSSGIAEVDSELTEAQKVQARFNLIMRQSADTLGDVERTADTTQGRLRMMRDRFEELQVELGSKLLPIMTRFAEAMIPLLQGFAELPDGVQTTILAILGITAALGPALIGLSVLTRSIAGLIRLLPTIGTGLLTVAGGMTGAGAATNIFRIALVTLMRVPVIALLAGIAAGISYLASRTDEASEAQQRFNTQVDANRALLDAMRDELAQNGASMETLGNAIDATIDRLISMGGWLGDVAQGIRDMGLDARQTAVHVLQMVAATARARLSDRRAQASSDLASVQSDASYWAQQAAYAATGNLVGMAAPSPDQQRGVILEQYRRGALEDIGVIRDVRDQMRALADVPDTAGGGGGGGGGGAAGSSGGGGSGGSGASGPSAAELAKERAQAERDGAQAAADKLETMREEAREQENALARYREELLMQVAQLDGDEAAIRALDEQRELRERIGALVDAGLDKTVATQQALDAMVALDEARADALERQAEARQRDFEYELARRRGDDMTALDRDRWERDRIDELMRDGRSRAEAEAQAQREGAQLARADVQGQWRDAFRGALRAALQGDLSGFVEQWLQDRAYNGLSNAFDMLADLLADLFADLFRDAGQGGKGGGGGLFGTLLNFGASLLGGHTPKAGGIGSGSIAGNGGFGKVPFAGGFATGGLIPQGAFGIVGEKGPEPVFAGPNGASVMSNAAMRDSFGAARVAIDVTTDGDWIDTRIVKVSGAVVESASEGIAAKAAGKVRRGDIRRQRSSFHGG